MRKHYKTIIPTGMKPRPKPHEVSAADILSRYFESDVSFILTATVGTPDVMINGITWEIKSPIGKGKNTIQKSLRVASRQSLNIVLDLRRCPLPLQRALGYVRQFQRNSKVKRRIVVITKAQKLIEF